MEKPIKSNYFVQTNSSNLFLRCLFIGLLKYLNCQMQTEYIEDGKKRKSWLPFILGSGSNEQRFLQDFFLQDQLDELNIQQRGIEGMLQRKPLASVVLNSISFQPSEYTNQFVEAERTVIDTIDGTTQTEFILVNRIPMSASFEIEVKTNTLNEALQIWEQFLNVFYKTQPFQFQWKGVPIYCNAGWSEDPEIKNTYEFSFGEEIEKGIAFDLEVEFYYPIFDESSKYTINDTMRGVTLDITDDGRLIKRPRNRTINRIDGKDSEFTATINEKIKGSRKETNKYINRQTEIEFINNVLMSESATRLKLGMKVNDTNNTIEQKPVPEKIKHTNLPPEILPIKDSFL
jgi:hypothetical protein